MKLLRKYLRSIAAFLVINMLYYTFGPTVAWALTAGPTAPEATSFEPVDTTDMVNLLTGDFVYNIPLLEVPGPSGGYPLALSYHGGIQNNQEASWVGLGWSLNPGAINRIVNGHPDDHYKIDNVNRVFWEGGATTSQSVGLSVGIANAMSVSADLTFANDTYRGSGTGFGMGASVGIAGNNTRSLSLGISVGQGPYGDMYHSAGLSVGISTAQAESINATASFGIAVTSSGYSSNGGIGFKYQGKDKKNELGQTISGDPISLVGASISSRGNVGVSIGNGGFSSSVHNSKAGKISSNSSGFNVDIPLYAGINLRLSRSYVRYWSDESTNVDTNGALYFPENTLTNEELYNASYDIYDLSTQTFDENYPNANTVLGGSFVDYDHYSVVAQGLSGSFRPYHFIKDLTRQNQKDQDDVDEILHYPLSQIDSKVNFAFVNEFSNKFLYQNDPLNTSDLDTEAVTYTMSNQFEYGEDDPANLPPISMIKFQNSKHIEYYTNEEILGSSTEKDPIAEGFIIDTHSMGFVRRGNGNSRTEQSFKKQIGGYKIVNESGVTYHFALPVYSYDEHIYSENIESVHDEDGHSFNLLTKRTPTHMHGC